MRSGSSFSAMRAAPATHRSFFFCAICENGCVENLSNKRIL
jgi:hypothetical protein